MVNRKSCLINVGASIVPLLVVAALGGMQPAQAADAKAGAGHTIIVGNTPTCRNATFTSIQAAVTAAAATDATISVCAGTYAGKVLVTDKTNLKLIGQKGATIVPEGDAFSGDLVEVANSTNVTFQGFTIDGRGTLNPDVDATGILYSESSGTIAKNTVVNWTTPDSATEAEDIAAIRILAGGSLAVAVKRNTITGFQGTAVDVEAGALLTISGNVISTTLDDVQDVTGIDIKPSATTSPHGKISGNKLSVTGSSDETVAFAIFISRSGPFVVSGNTTLNFVAGIGVSSRCASVDGTRITRNRVTNDGGDGIFVFVQADDECDLVHADDYEITGNKVVNTGTEADGGIVLIAVGSDTAHAFIRNALVKRNTIANFDPAVATATGAGGVVEGVFAPNTVR